MSGNISNNRLARALVTRGITPSQIARELGCDRRVIAFILEGQTRTLHPDQRARLEALAARHLAPGIVTPPVHHERCPPRFGR